MTQEHWTEPSACIARRVKELRARRGWSAERLADACKAAGSPELNRSVIANIESRRRRHVTVEEALTLAYVLDVAPIHLLVPTDVDEQYDAERYAAAPDRFLPIPAARAWVRGDFCPPGCDPRTYWSEVPAEEFRPSQPTAEQVAERGAQVQEYREMVGDVKAAQARYQEGSDDGQR